MEVAIWIGLLLDVALLVWLIVSVQSIKGYLRRIAISLPVTPEQMGLITGTIRTEDAMAIFVKAGGKMVAVSNNVGNSWVRFDTSALTSTLDPELMGLLRSRQSTIAPILRARQKSNR
ncbi:MAG: hypothetical protein WKF77_16315 [Planctomycetaceae bacterium]